MFVVLRLGHRLGRDDRISTHCGLVSRALGASAIIYTGEHDEKMVEGVNDVAQRFGGRFTAHYEESAKNVVKYYKKKKFTVVHLTVYGLHLQKEIRRIKKSKNVLLIVGGEKVPGEIYHLADYNISVTNQPHSEVAALAIFMNQYFGTKALDQKFPKAKISILPNARGKTVVEKDRKK
jgi:tRNA (cytidine56-2'-O)-methyltransferase